MIRGEHSLIRTIELDDAGGLWQLYDVERPLSFLLDRRQELPLPSRDDVRRYLERNDPQHGQYYVVEDATGQVMAFCGVRGGAGEHGFAELGILPFADSFFEAPACKEVLAFLHQLVFFQLRRYKAMAHCLDTEVGWCKCLKQQGFESSGVQRQVLFTGGRWHDLETFTLFRPVSEKETINAS